MVEMISIKVMQSGKVFYAEAEHFPSPGITPDKWNTKKHGWKDDSLEKCLQGITKAILEVRDEESNSR